MLSDKLQTGKRKKDLNINCISFEDVILFFFTEKNLSSSLQQDNKLHRSPPTGNRQWALNITINSWNVFPLAMAHQS